MKQTLAVPLLTIVVPCYNEQEVLRETIGQLTEFLDGQIKNGAISRSSYILFVDDGSQDATWQIIKQENNDNEYVQGVRLAKNRGHQLALLAGLEAAKGDITVSIDADMQDDISVMAEMVAEFKKGSEIVYGVRSSRTTDSAFKRNTAQSYYWLLSKFGVDVVYNHADYRLMSRKALDALKEFGETNLFLRGLIPTLGFQTSQVYYSRAERFAGESKYPLKKMLALAVEGVTSFSSVPLRFVSILGLLVFLVSMLVSFWALGTFMFTDNAIPGWTSSVLPMYLLGGIQLLSLGVIGEYVGKIYLETKRRPRYIVMDKIE